MHKKAATNHFRRGEAVLTETTREAYYRWLRGNERLWRVARVDGTKPPGKFFWAFYSWYAGVGRKLRANPYFTRSKTGGCIDRQGYRFYRRLNRRINLVEHLFPWAVEELAARYAPEDADIR